MFTKRITLLLFSGIFIFAMCVIGCSQEIEKSPTRKKIDLDESLMWSRFFLPKTNLVYECLSSFDEKTCQNHLPTADEVKRQFPNPCGYATGMEDCAILGGTVLAGLVDKYNAQQKYFDRTSANARKILDGLDTLVQPDGFVARGLCPEDKKSFYINSSIDQYTHLVHGMWKFYNSPMSNSADKKKIANALTRISERLIRNVKKENDYCSLRADGKPCALRISRFTFEKPHAAARQAMIYGATWQATGDKKYYDLYRNLIYDAIKVSEEIKITGWTPIWAMLQMQFSLETLRDLEQDQALKKRIIDLMQKVADLSNTQSKRVAKKFENSELETLYGDWRNPPE
ncbi:MAG: hypothetical protein IKC88_04305, partial [Opitutales bacterium]|nr:hypothetical protein [Opitutales bacterium]